MVMLIFVKIITELLQSNAKYLVVKHTHIAPVTELISVGHMREIKTFILYWTPFRANVTPARVNHLGQNCFSSYHFKVQFL